MCHFFLGGNYIIMGLGSLEFCNRCLCDIVINACSITSYVPISAFTPLSDLWLILMFWLVLDHFYNASILPDFFPFLSWEELFRIRDIIVISWIGLTDIFPINVWHVSLVTFTIVTFDRFLFWEYAAYFCGNAFYYSEVVSIMIVYSESDLQFQIMILRMSIL